MKALYSFLLLSTLFLWACQSGTQQNSAPSEQQPDRLAQPAAGDFTIVPGRAMGKITAANCSKTAIAAAYGAANVKEDSVYVGEGFYLPGLVVFPETKNELRVAYDPQISPDQPAFLQVAGVDGDWHTESGLRVGSTVQEVVAANGRHFKFSGFGWDYGGTVTNWEGGQLEGLLVRFDLDYDEPRPDKFQGDREVSSDDPDLPGYNVRVASISLRF